MADLPKRRFVTYRDADSALRAQMNKLIDKIENSPDSHAAIANFGADEIARFKEAIRALEEFFRDPTSPEAPPEKKEALRQQYLKGAQGISLVLSAGTEMLRRYDVEHVSEARERYNESQDAANAAYLRNVAECREELACRIAEIELPERTDDFVKAAALRIEAAVAFERSIKNGLPLEEAITVKKSPLRLVMPKVPGVA